MTGYDVVPWSCALFLIIFIMLKDSYEETHVTNENQNVHLLSAVLTATKNQSYFLYADTLRVTGEVVGGVK